MTAATITRIDPPSATVTKLSGCKLCIQGPGGLVEFRNTTPVDPAKAADFRKKMDTVWESCRQKYNTEELTIDFGRKSVTYCDATGKVHVVNLKDGAPPADLAQIQQEVDAVWTCMSGIWPDLKRPEPLGPRPSEEIHKSFGALGKMRARSFITLEHFGSVKGFVDPQKPQIANSVMNQLLAGEVFTQVLESEVEALIATQKRLIKQTPTPQADARLRSLERFRDEVRQADRYAMYWAIGARIEAGSAMTNDFEERKKVANRVQEGMSEALAIKLAGKGSKSADTAQITMYAREASSLVFHDPAENVEKIQQENSQGQDVRYPRGPSMAEFLVHNITELSVGVFNPKESLKSQGQQWDLDGDFIAALTTARAAGQARLQQVEQVHPTLPYDQRLPRIPK